MAVEEDTLIFPSDDECSSFGNESHFADSELELGDFSSSYELETPVSSAVSYSEEISDSPLRASVQICQTGDNGFRPLYTSVRSHRTNHDIIEEGIRLYLMFLQQEIMRNCLHPPEFLNRTNRVSAQNMMSLRALADQFATSTQRQWIRQQAQMVQLHRLDFHSFTDLLIGLFQEGGVTWERILVLFFFCTDISIRALRGQLTQQFERIQNWTSQFIQDTVCTWVELEGGWGVILQQSVTQATKLAVLGFCCVGIIALCIYIRNNAK